MISVNTTMVPITATPTRTGSASAEEIIPAAAALPAKRDGASDGSGAISEPTWVPCGVANP
ncbi:hypothetical protein MAHJHV57_50280 [Mycobacterium avium subsp. hominissuis]